MFQLENTSYKRVHEPDAGFIDNCSEFHQSISPIEEEVDKSGSSFLIAFNQGKSRSWTICHLPLSRMVQRLIGKWKSLVVVLHKIIWNSSEFRCSDSGRLLESENGMVQLSSVNSELRGREKASEVSKQILLI